MPNGEFEKTKNEATTKATAADKTASESKPENKKKAFTSAAEEWVTVAKLWKGKNNVFYAESLQKAAAHYRSAGEHEDAGIKEEDAAKALVDAAERCKSSDPITAKKYYDQAAVKFTRAAGDFGAKPDPASQKNALSEKETAEKNSKALDPFTKR